MDRADRWLVRTAVAFALAVVTGLVAGPTTASAQDPISGFFNMIFSGGRRQAPPPQRFDEMEPLDLHAQKKPVTRPPEPRIVEAPKNADAQTVLVLGDIEAAGLANGLQIAFAEEPSLQVVAKVKNSTGLAREGDGDWVSQAPKLIADATPDFLVTMIGINDWQTITVGGAKLEAGSDEWNKIYVERIDRYLAALKATGKPFWWVGLPPTADPDLGPTRRAAFSAFLSSLNDLARPRVEAAGGTFVDIWSAFTDEEGHYTQMGPDVDGQVKRLRMNDGILFTRAGRRKLAFFVESGILRLKRGEAPVAAAPEAPKVQPKAEEDIVGAPPPLPAPPWAVAGPVVPLDGPVPAGETGLAGGTDRTPPKVLPGGYPVVATPGHLRLVEGAPLEPPIGRVDAGVRRQP
jgi:hypothetical protein